MLHKKLFYLTLGLLTLNSALAVPIEPKTQVPNFLEKTFTTLTNIQSKNLAPKKLFQIVSVPLTLIALEHALCGNKRYQDFVHVPKNYAKRNYDDNGKVISIDRVEQPSVIFTNYWKHATTCLLLNLLHEILPQIVENKTTGISIKKELKNFITKGHFISFLKEELQFPTIVAFMLYQLCFNQQRHILSKIAQEINGKNIKNVELQLTEPTKAHIMVANPWIETLSFAASIFMPLDAATSTVIKTGLETIRFKRIYISPETFAKLSPELQKEILEFVQETQNRNARELARQLFSLKIHAQNKGMELKTLYRKRFKPDRFPAPRK